MTAPDPQPPAAPEMSVEGVVTTDQPKCMDPELDAFVPCGSVR